MPFKTKDETLLAIQDDAKSLLAKDIEYAVSSAEETFPVITPEEFEDILPGTPPFDEEWSREDESAIRREWRRDGLKDAKIKTTNKKPGLWKTCVRFMRCLPTDIIGPETHLAVDIASNQELNLPGRPKAPHWSDKLCKDIIKLVPHPMFHGNPGLLATAIQYTVICCTNDCRPWPLENYSGDAFLQAFLQTVKEKQNGQTPADKLHRSAKRRFQQAYPSGSPGFWSELFSSIELAAAAANSVHREEPDHEQCTPCYLVTVSDLKVLIKALDHMTHGSLTIFHPTNVISDVFQITRTPDDLPLDKDGSLTRAHELALLHQLRWKRLQSQPEQSPSDRENEDDTDDEEEDDNTDDSEDEDSVEDKSSSSRASPPSRKRPHSIEEQECEWEEEDEGRNTLVHPASKKPRLSARPSTSSAHQGMNQRRRTEEVPESPQGHGMATVPEGTRLKANRNNSTMPRKMRRTQEVPDSPQGHDMAMDLEGGESNGERADSASPRENTPAESVDYSEPAWILDTPCKPSSRRREPSTPHPARRRLSTGSSRSTMDRAIVPGTNPGPSGSRRALQARVPSTPAQGNQRARMQYREENGIRRSRPSR